MSRPFVFSRKTWDAVYRSELTGKMPEGCRAHRFLQDYASSSAHSADTFLRASRQSKTVNYRAEKTDHPKHSPYTSGFSDDRDRGSCTDLQSPGARDIRECPAYPGKACVARNR